MDFLRRLHPSHAEAPGAVRPDLGAWRASGLPRRVAEGDSRVPSGPVAQADARIEATPGPAAGMPAPGAAGARLPSVAASTAPIASSRSAPVAPGGLPRVAATGPSTAAVEAVVGATVAMPSSPAMRAAAAGARQVLPAAGQATGRLAAEVVRGAAATTAPAAAGLPTPPTASPPPPLRAGVQPLQRPAEPAAPAIVQVTIDRIDVRVPPERAAADAPRRVRPAPAVALADYLREREGGRR